VKWSDLGSDHLLFTSLCVTPKRATPVFLPFSPLKVLATLHFPPNKISGPNSRKRRPGNELRHPLQRVREEIKKKLKIIAAEEEKSF